MVAATSGVPRNTTRFFSVLSELEYSRNGCRCLALDPTSEETRFASLQNALGVAKRRGPGAKSGDKDQAATAGIIEITSKISTTAAISLIPFLS